MAWKCPACQTQIFHEGDGPQPGQIYRCHICRLELILDEALQQLTVAPRPGDPPKRRATGRDQA
jgi:hypothetical protein